MHLSIYISTSLKGSGLDIGSVACDPCNAGCAVLGQQHLAARNASLLTMQLFVLIIGQLASSAGGIASPVWLVSNFSVPAANMFDLMIQVLNRTPKVTCDRGLFEINEVNTCRHVFHCDPAVCLLRRDPGHHTTSLASVVGLRGFDNATHWGLSTGDEWWAACKHARSKRHDFDSYRRDHLVSI